MKTHKRMFMAIACALCAATLFGTATDVTAMNQEAKGSFYKIIDAPNGITGTFRLAADWPSGWSLKYSSDGKSVYVHYPKGTKIIVR